MASISKDKNGTKRIVFYNADKRQECIRLGKTPMKIAEMIKVHVENLLSAQASKVSVVTETAEWLAKLPDELYTKFVRKGLATPRKIVGTLGEMLPDIIKEKSIGVKPTTVDIYRQAERSLYKHFGKDWKVDTITATDAKEFGLWLAKHGRAKKPGGLAPKTVSKQMEHVHSFFHIMTERGIIPCNPFKGLVQKVAVDDRRNKYIDEETILKVMEYAPDAEWRLIIALWRFAGLRAFSEVLTLKWEDVLWDQEMIMVHAPKTERYGTGVRKIPFFPHIEECLREAFEQASEGAIYVVEKHAPLYLRGQKERVFICRQGNIGTTFKKIILRAGIVPWGKLIHNLRASFETDLMNFKYGYYAPTTIAKWLGHSPTVMLQHYGRIQQSDFDQIAAACERVREKKKRPMRSGEINLASTLTQKAGLTAGVGNTDLPKTKASLKASLYTAVRGGIGGNGAETPSCTNVQHALENKEHEGNKRQEMVSCVNAPNSQSGGHGSRTRNTFRCTSFPMRPLAIRIPSKHLPHYNHSVELDKVSFF